MNKKRIVEMDNELNYVALETKKFAKSLEEFVQLQNHVSALTTYYGSDDWFIDFNSYEETKKDFKAGILSEDTMYDLLDSNRTLALKMLDLATLIIKND